MRIKKTGVRTLKQGDMVLPVAIAQAVREKIGTGGGRKMQAPVRGRPNMPKMGVGTDSVKRSTQRASHPRLPRFEVGTFGADGGKSIVDQGEMVASGQTADAARQAGAMPSGGAMLPGVFGHKPTNRPTISGTLAKLPSFDKGTFGVTDDTAALTHADEMVVPSATADAAKTVGALPDTGAITDAGGKTGATEPPAPITGPTEGAPTEPPVAYPGGNPGGPPMADLPPGAAPNPTPAPAPSRGGTTTSPSTATQPPAYQYTPPPIQGTQYADVPVDAGGAYTPGGAYRIDPNTGRVALAGSFNQPYATVPFFQNTTDMANYYRSIGDITQANYYDRTYNGVPATSAPTPTFGAPAPGSRPAPAPLPPTLTGGPIPGNLPPGAAPSPTPAPVNRASLPSAYASPAYAGMSQQAVLPAFLQNTQNQLPPPNQIVARNWLKMDPNSQQLMKAAYEAQGYDPGYIDWLIGHLLPGRAGYGAGTVGRFLG